MCYFAISFHGPINLLGYEMSHQFESVVLSETPITFAGEAAGMERFFPLEHWTVRATFGDEIATREDDRIIWKRGSFVLIVAFVTGDKIERGERIRRLVTIREYKQAAERILLGLPAGAIKAGETPEAAARRELEEETGYVPTESAIVVRSGVLNSPDKSTEKHHIVLFPNVTLGSRGARQEVTESILDVELHTPYSALEDSDFQIGLHRLAVYETLTRK